MKVEFSFTNVIDNPTVTIPIVLAPVLPINKIKVMINYCYDPYAEPKMAAVLHYISTHFRLVIPRLYVILPCIKLPPCSYQKMNYLYVKLTPAQSITYNDN